MIDVHCHLEQKDYEKDRDAVIQACMGELKAVVNSSPYYPHFMNAVELHKKYPNFVFISLAIHPIYIEEVSSSTIEKAISFIRENKKDISAIGETGLDYYHVKDEKLRLRQQDMFKQFVEVANELKKPLVIHCRDAFDDCINILESNGMKNKKVLMHLFSSKRHIKTIIDDGWSISIGPSITMSKDIKKIARDMPLNKMMLETDSPWFGFGKRNTPLSIKGVAAKIAETKKMSFDEVWETTAKNAVEFFGLPIKI
jgi:TatD DNase family protein